MQVLDRNIHQARALIIDSNATARSVMAAQLRDLGVQQVRQLSRVQDARLLLESAPQDIVLCEMNFDGAPMSGQDLLDELRREQLLPYSTAFILISGEASATQVMEAAESAVDGYLVKPCSGAALADRLQEARRRKLALKPVHDAIHAGDLARAASLAERHYHSREPYTGVAGQLAVELWLRAEQPQRALVVCEAVLERRSLPWAKAARARCRWVMGELEAARLLLDALVSEAPSYADAHELRGRVLAEQGEFAPALEAFRQAARLSPGCLLRMQQQGAMAFYLGHGDEAVQQLERSVALGRKSKLFDPLSLALLGLLRFDRGDRRALTPLNDALAWLRNADPASTRLERFAQLLTGLDAALTERNTTALAVARTLSDESADAGYDLEAAALALALWQRLPGSVVPAKEYDALVRRLGQRFAVSAAATEVLVACAGTRAGAADLLRDCLDMVRGVAAEAQEKCDANDTVGALNLLLQWAEQTHNAHLAERALALAESRRSELPDGAEWVERTDALLQTLKLPLHFIAGTRGSARSPGGLALRT